MNDGCWMDKLSEKDAEVLDGFDRQMILDELAWRGRRVRTLEAGMSLVTTMMLATPPMATTTALMNVSPEKLAEAVAERVLQGLAASGMKADYYTTNAIGPHLPGKTRTWMKRNIRKLPGATKIERDWIISHENYELWLRIKDSMRVRLSAKGSVPTKDDEALAEEALRSAGYRKNGRSA